MYNLITNISDKITIAANHESHPAVWEVDETEMKRLTNSFVRDSYKLVGKLEESVTVSVALSDTDIFLINAHLCYCDFIRDYLCTVGKLVSKGSHRVKFDLPGSVDPDWMWLNSGVYPINIVNDTPYKQMADYVDEINVSLLGYNLSISLVEGRSADEFKLRVDGKRRALRMCKNGVSNEIAMTRVLKGLSEILGTLREVHGILLKDLAGRLSLGSLYLFGCKDDYLGVRCSKGNWKDM